MDCEIEGDDCPECDGFGEIDDDDDDRDDAVEIDCPACHGAGIIVFVPGTENRS